jgi:hypothetical protein
MSKELQQQDYEGNGWSKYQLLVLQQLEDHNKVLQNLNKEIADIKQSIAVHEAEFKMWRTQTTLEVKQIREDVDGVLYEDKGIGHRLSSIERHVDLDARSETDNKATRALYGSVALVAINAIIQIVGLYFRK